MKLLRIFFLLLFSCLSLWGNLFAQTVSHKKTKKNSGDSSVVANPFTGDSTNLAASTLKDAGPIFTSPVVSKDTGEIAEGTIFVRKPHIIPFVTVDYKLYLSRVRMAQVLIPMGGNIPPQSMTVPIYDSGYYQTAAYARNTELVYPKKAELYSKYFSQGLTYQYQPSDTPRIDTMYVGMEILENGKLKYITPDTEYVGNMPDELVQQLNKLSFGLADWDDGGGFKTKPKLFRRSQTTRSTYYCELFIVVSSFPTTQTEKNTGTSYSIFDYPLNSPPIDDQQDASFNNDVKPKQ